MTARDCPELAPTTATDPTVLDGFVPAVPVCNCGQVHRGIEAVVECVEGRAK